MVGGFWDDNLDLIVGSLDNSAQAKDAEFLGRAAVGELPVFYKIFPP